MNVRYSKLSDTSIDTISKHSLDVASLPKQQRSTTARPRPLTAWMTTLWPLVAHFILSIGTAAFVLYYLNHRGFNVADHIAYVQTTEDKKMLPFSLTQSDAVTILSALIVVQKGALAACTTPFCWRIIVFLMEKYGLHRQDLKGLVKYRILAPQISFASVPAFVAGNLLLAVLAANLTSPVLTGSITWSPQNLPINNLTVSPVRLSKVDPGRLKTFPDWYIKKQVSRDGLVQKAVGLASIAWGRAAEKGIYKRVASSVEALGINTTIKEVTIPYFATHSIDWTKKKSELPAYIIKNSTHMATWDLLSRVPSNIPLIYLGAAVLFSYPITQLDWSDVPLASRMIDEKGLLVFWLGTPSINATQGLPSSIYIHTTNDTQRRYVFAWVNFTAGVGKCTQYRCILSSPSTIQNNASITPKPHLLTTQALAMAPAIAISLANQNSSLPSSWNDTNQYIEALLQRSYSAAWNILVDNFEMSQVNSSYRPSLPRLIADVNQPRVYTWLGLQLSVTFLCCIFLILLSQLSEFPLIGDTTLTPFYLNTTRLPESSDTHIFTKGSLLVEEEHSNRLKVKIE
ncbi:hypothetical protein RSOLAG1IB_07220 [Rhizoctonia solani AG-1 IB]|uniref:Transmembrane protein n=1 Tax=Thanatephorus cucumeris (strain AG1-IB / isolate 7/3/14) TaxID=1108050 RepID=A0A0B7F9F0_THACB|nr:hypothetical protein RSOLAG1IB_07220 [Rhizoctonia solani AG-1 IB]